MKATLYRLTSKNVLVIEDKNGTRFEYPPTEARAHQIAQDVGIQYVSVEHGLETFLAKPEKKIKMV